MTNFEKAIDRVLTHEGGYAGNVGVMIKMFAELNQSKMQSKKVVSDE